MENKRGKLVCLCTTAAVKVTAFAVTVGDVHRLGCAGFRRLCPVEVRPPAARRPPARNLLELPGYSARNLLDYRLDF